MTRTIKHAVTVITVAAVLLAAGCTNPNRGTMAEAKAAAKARWQDARSGIIFSLAQQQFESGDIDKAEVTCRQAMEQMADRVEFHELFARIALERGQLERAYHHLEIANKLDAKRPSVHYIMGVVLQRWQRYDAALEQYETAYQLTPDSVERLLAVGETLVKLGRTEEAVKRLSDKLDYFENNAAIRVTLGRIHMLEHRLDMAVKSFRAASLLAPDDTTVLEQLAMAQLASGHHGDSIDTIKQLMLQPSHADRVDLKFALGDCYAAINKPVEARAVFLELTRQRPNDANAWVKLGQAAWIVQDEIRVREAAARIIALAPDRYEGFLLRGMAERGAGRNEQALVEFDRAAAVAPDNALPLIMRGMTLEKTGDRQAAVVAYQQALKVAPNDERAKRLLAGVTP